MCAQSWDGWPAVGRRPKLARRHALPTPRSGARVAKGMSSRRVRMEFRATRTLPSTWHRLFASARVRPHLNLALLAARAVSASSGISSWLGVAAPASRSGAVTIPRVTRAPWEARKTRRPTEGSNESVVSTKWRTKLFAVLQGEIRAGMRGQTSGRNAGASARKWELGPPFRFVFTAALFASTASALDASTSAISSPGN